MVQTQTEWQYKIYYPIQRLRVSPNTNNSNNSDNKLYIFIIEKTVRQIDVHGN